MVVVILHFVWATRGRRRTLHLDGDAKLHTCIVDACRSLDCELLAVGNGDDHVHAVVRMSTSIAPSTLAQRMKGTSARLLNVRWQARYFAESVTPTDVDPLLRYVQNQRRHHDDSHPFEVWQIAPAS